MNNQNSNGLIYCNNLAATANYLIKEAHKIDQAEEIENLIVMLSNLERLMDQSRIFVNSDERKEVNVKLDIVRKNIWLLAEKCDKEKLKEKLNSYGEEIKIRFT